MAIPKLGIRRAGCVSESGESNPVINPASDGPVMGDFRCSRLGAHKEHEGHSDRVLWADSHVQKAPSDTLTDDEERASDH